MSATADLATTDSSATQRPYPPSFIDRFVTWLDRLPVPAWVAYGGLALLSIAYVNVEMVLLGRNPRDVAARFTAIALIPVFSLGLLRHLNRVASESLDRFRPLLDLDAAGVERLRYELTVLPRDLMTIVIVGMSLFTISGAYNAPGNFEIVGASAAASAMLVVYACLIGATYGALAVQVIRQLRLVERVHREANRVDLFNVGPLQAFSRLTSQASLGILVLVVILVVTTIRQFMAASTSELASVAAVGLYAALGVAAIASFALPLYGLHRRIAEEKERLQADADARLTSLLGALHADASRLDLSRADGLNKLLGSAFQEREVLARLPTWPWQAATLRGFVSALLLPVLVYVLARAAERVVL